MLGRKKPTELLNPCPEGCTGWLCSLTSCFPPGTALRDGLVGLGLIISILLFHRGAATTIGWGWQHFEDDQCVLRV